MTDDSNSTGDRAGYRKPPRANRFRKGQSGHPAGRPKGRHNHLPYEAVLGQIVTIREDGVERRVAAAEAFLLFIMKRGLEGDGPSARAAMEAIEQAKASGLVGKQIERLDIRRVVVDPGSVSGALELLRMGKKMDRFRDTATMMLEPWLVEMALTRLGDRRLPVDQQKEVVGATRTPWKVRWPDWWAKPHGQQND
jgi:hypothetical protein